jgi:hypothetical protein
MSGNEATLAKAKDDNAMDVVPHMYDTGPKGNTGVKYNMAIILNPCSETAITRNKGC